MDKETPKKQGNWHDRTYKKLLIIPAVLLIFSIAFLINFSIQNNGDIFEKDISLTGGTSLTIYEQIDKTQIENALSGELEDLNVREVSNLITGEQKGITIQTKTPSQKTKEIVEDYLGYELITSGENSNADLTTNGSLFSESFYKQLLFAVLLAFVFMAIVVFILFRTAIPSLAVLISAFADIVMTLVLIDILGIKMSTAGIIAFLMLIGYSVDTDIMLTTRILKRTEGSLNQRIYGALKTGLTMTLTSFFAFLIALIIVSSFSQVLAQIFTILVIGLGFDLLNTWITNISILKWYVLSGRSKK
jgi:preprotein translocase subunit SecF